MRKIYSLETCEKLINTYIKKGGKVVTLQEGVLGLGVVLCFGDSLKTSIIKEVYLNEWSSGHTIRMYNIMPAKYNKMLEKLENQIA